MRCPNRVILILATLLLSGCSCRDSKLGDDPAKWTVGGRY
jgi:type IV pilus biogenesis protein CpaD/CtpE